MDVKISDFNEEEDMEIVDDECNDNIEEVKQPKIMIIWFIIVFIYN